MAHFKLILEKVFLVWNFAVEAEKLLFLLVEGLVDVLASFCCLDPASLTLMFTLFF